MNVDKAKLLLSLALDEDAHGVHCSWHMDGNCDCWQESVREAVMSLGGEPPRRPFSADLEHAVGDWARESVDNAAALWGALSNVVWKHEDGREEQQSFRVADGMVGEIVFQAFGDDPGTWYCRGCYEVVARPIYDAMHAVGWTPHPYSLATETRGVEEIEIVDEWEMN